MLCSETRRAARQFGRELVKSLCTDTNWEAGRGTLYKDAGADSINVSFDLGGLKLAIFAGLRLTVEVNGVYLPLPLLVRRRVAKALRFRLAKDGIRALAAPPPKRGKR